ncbi:hypothetical protein ACXJY6_14810 [Vibrio sp. RC27]
MNITSILSQCSASSHFSHFVSSVMLRNNAYLMVSMHSSVATIFADKRDNRTNNEMIR